MTCRQITMTEGNGNFTFLPSEKVRKEKVEGRKHQVHFLTFRTQTCLLLCAEVIFLDENASVWTHTKYTPNSS